MKAVREKGYGRVTFAVSETPNEDELKISRNMGFEVIYKDGKVSVTGGNPNHVRMLKAILDARASL